MPMYEYYCPDCHTKFEALRPMSKADEAIICKQCEGERATRTLSLFATFSSESNRVIKMSGAGHGGGGCCGGACGCSH